MVKKRLSRQGIAELKALYKEVEKLIRGKKGDILTFLLYYLDALRLLLLSFKLKEIAALLIVR